MSLPLLEVIESGLIRSILGILELSSEKNHTFSTIWKSWFSYEPPLLVLSWTWDVTHERALSPADLFGGKAPVGALIGLLERIY